MSNRYNPFHNDAVLSIHGYTFHILSDGTITCDDGLNLGDLDTCLEEGENIRMLMETIGNINL